MKYTKKTNNGDYITYEGPIEIFYGLFGCSGCLIAIILIVAFLSYLINYVPE